MSDRKQVEGNVDRYGYEFKISHEIAVLGLAVIGCITLLLIFLT